MAVSHAELEVIQEVIHSRSKVDDDGRIFSLQNKNFTIAVTYPPLIDKADKELLASLGYHSRQRVQFTMTRGRGRASITLESPNVRFMPEGSEIGQTEALPEKIIFTDSEHSASVIVDAKAVRLVYIP